MFTRLEKASLGFLSSPSEELNNGEIGNTNLKQEMEVTAPCSPRAQKSLETIDLNDRAAVTDDDDDGKTELDSITEEVISVYDQVSNLVINLKRSSVGMGGAPNVNGRQSMPALGVSMLTDSSYSMSTQIKVRNTKY